MTSADCCTDLCVNGICDVAGMDGGIAGDGGAGGSYSCAALPPDCHTSPATCECVVAHQPCGGLPVLSCTADGAAIDLTCSGE